ERARIDGDRGLAGRRAGRSGAMSCVAGYPVKLFTESVTESDGLALIPITNKSITEFYPRAEIPAGTYGGQPNAVPTVAVKATMISFDFRRRDCDLVGSLAWPFPASLPVLSRNGVPMVNRIHP